MKRDVLLGLIPALLFMLLIQGTGCGTTKSVYKKAWPKKGDLKKRVLVLPILDQAGAGDEKVTQLTATLVELLQKDEKLLVQTGTMPVPSRQRVRSPEFGVVIDPALIAIADQMDMNVLVAGVLNPYEMKVKRSGWWPVRWVKREHEVSLLLNAYDTINGTIIVSHLEARKIKTPKDNPEGEQEKTRIDENRLQEELSDIIEDHASTLIDELGDQPWRGKIISVDGEDIVINAGEDIGLTSESIFEVFGEGEGVRSLSGRFLYLSGPKVGEIKTVKFMPSRATAVPVIGGPFKAGQVIKLK